MSNVAYLTSAEKEIEKGERFSFGKNWSKFLRELNDERIASAMASLEEYLGKGFLNGKSFLDIGSGSGLFSLAARKLGAKVYSFDYDPQSVACSQELRRRYFPDDPNWNVSQGSVLDPVFLNKLGQFDVVYSWGVLHHTGAMWQAFENVIPLVKPGGKLYIAIYNDQGWSTKVWWHIKRLYCKSPLPIKYLILSIAFMRLRAVRILIDLLRGKPTESWRNYAKRGRGMSPWYDLIDWVGGYPFEVAKPEEVFYFFYKQGFYLDKLKTCGGRLGCNQFVFIRPEQESI
ncbi:class I SAM-dependent methyltransferase [Thermoflavifilum thermophilum]|uniref:2-polyprenyl-6-hydroxyphenyl methylase / 3-demethylubiquinone-9 3-methyltransferase n=1 Tax=Thermoflavifilum thermophilum TaxID=1393122 RepID=A0A1I7MY63_9BACT|nr:class I SAM-dependent methyltransferase [Thermoflavifilum thermophilum]SFV27367.1 2-polyprenyl-6-hydroxyphenyl methylase / 3-demethylubiquinone-9 3-methyltransferase [Thermoflavifilum thermophilum]